MITTRNKIKLTQEHSLHRVRTWEISTTIHLAKDDSQRAIVKLDGKWWDAKLVSVGTEKEKGKVGSEGAVAIWTLGV